MKPEDFTEAQVAECFAAATELRAVPQPLIVEFQPYDAYLLVGLLQLSLSAKQLPVASHAFAVGMVATLKLFFEATGCNTIVSQIDQGPQS